MSLEGTQSLITGGSSGIGLATAKLLVERGSRVHSFDIQELREHVDGMQTHIVNVENAAAVRIVMNAIAGQIHILMLNAGILERRQWKDLSTGDVQKLFDVNVCGSVHTLIAAFEQGKLAPDAVILQMCSIVGIQPSERLPAYSLTKKMIHTLIALMRVLRSDLRVKGIYPGAVETPMTTQGFASLAVYREQAAKNWGTVTQPQHIAQGIVELIEDEEAKDLVWDGESRTHVLKY